MIDSHKMETEEVMQDYICVLNNWSFRNPIPLPKWSSCTKIIHHFKNLEISDKNFNIYVIQHFERPNGSIFTFC